MTELFERLMQPVNTDRNALATIVATCEEMLLLAKKGDWDRVYELEQRRSNELTDFFSRPVKPEDSVVVTEAIFRISELNDRLVEMATAARHSVVASAQRDRQMIAAAEQYQSIARRV